LLSATVSYINHPDKNYTQTFIYDSIGNMTSNSDLGTMNYLNNNPHQLTSVGSRNFVYDNAGNLNREIGLRKYYWDHRNRLKNTYDIASENNTYYLYDHNNQRFIKWTEDYLYYPPDPEEPTESIATRDLPSISEESLSQETLALDGTGYWAWTVVSQDKYVDKYYEKNLNNQTKSHVFLNGIKIATINNNDNPYYIISDHLNSSNLLTTPTGTIAEVEDYKPYGTTNYQNTIQDLSDNYGFTSKEKDPESNLQYYGARYMDNEIGRFTSIDPLLVKLHNPQEVSRITEKDLRILLADPQKLNSYSYAYNNPMIMNDPTGEGPVIVLIVVGVVELVFSAWDALDTSNALFGENVSTGDKVESGGYLVAGLALPGGGYGHVDEGVSALKAVDKTVSKSINNAVNKIGNTISDHLTKTDYAGFIRDLSKAPVWSDNLRRNFDHYDEVMSAYKGLQNNVSKLTRYLDNYNLDKKTVDTINKAIDTAKSHIDRIDNILRSH